MINDIQQIIEEMPSLPTMPTIVSEALNIIKDPKSNINQLSDVISKDISLTTEILKLVNSSYYGFPTQITTINKAMALIGLNKVKSLIMSVALKPLLVSYCGKSVWEHSIRCAIGCESLAKSLGYNETEEAFVIGLLHDIGKSVLEVYNKNAANDVKKLISAGADGLIAEKTLFGFTHTEAGEILVKKWKLPTLISSSARYHHTPHLSENPAMVGLVYMADRITQETLKYPIFDPDIADMLDFEISDPIQMREEIFEKSKHIIGALAGV